MPGLWQVKELVMEVIKIPQEHVDSCLFFRPGGESGRLPGRCTVLSARRTAGREWEGRRTWSKARERRGQMWEEWEWKDARGTLEGGQKRVRERERDFDMNEKMRQMNVEVLLSCAPRQLGTVGCAQRLELQQRSVRGLSEEQDRDANTGFSSNCQIKSRKSSMKHFC